MNCGLRKLPLPDTLVGSSTTWNMTPSPELCASLYGVGAEAERNRRALALGEVQVVVTGQQPSFPAPLGLSLFKAATAVALAVKMTKLNGVRHIPLFWSGSDDSDFAEISGQWVVRDTGPPLHVALTAAYRRKGAFVGDLDIAAAWDELRPFVSSEVHARFKPEPGEDLGRREARLLARLFSDYGLLVLDARTAAVRTDAVDLFSRYLNLRNEFASLLDSSGDKLEQAGLERPFRAGLGERALFLLRRRRRNLPSVENYGRDALDRLKRDPSSLSPNASLRPLVQDYILPVAAAVLGPGEWAYHRQLRPLFDLLELPFPAAVPRLQIEANGEMDYDFPAGGRVSSPLLQTDAPLADPDLLLLAAQRHLDLLDNDDHCILVHEES